MVITSIIQAVAVPATASLDQINSLLLACPLTQITTLHQVHHHCQHQHPHPHHRHLPPHSDHHSTPGSSSTSSSTSSSSSSSSAWSQSMSRHHHHPQFHFHFHHGHICQRRAEKLMLEKRFSEAKVDYQCAIETKGRV